MVNLIKFNALCADPPWAFDDKLPGKSRGAEKHYKVMSCQEIADYLLPPISDNALCFLWRVASQQQAALDVMTSWGFILKTEIIWIKKTKTNKSWFGMGRIVRAAHEICLVGKRGKVKILDHSIRSTFEAVVGKHSEKPESFYRNIVERLVAPPYVELFARRKRSGWICLGDELNETL